MVAFSARRLVRPAISLIILNTSSILRAAATNACTTASVRRTSLTASSAMRADSAPWRPISAIAPRAYSVALATACTLARACRPRRRQTQFPAWPPRSSPTSMGGASAANSRAAASSCRQLADCCSNPRTSASTRFTALHPGRMLRRPLRGHALGLDDAAAELLDRLAIVPTLVVATATDDGDRGVVPRQPSHQLGSWQQ